MKNISLVNKFIILTSLFFLLTSSFAFAQNYNTLIANAENFYTNKDYNNSILAYKKAFKINNSKAQDFYNAACSAALLGNKKLAFNWLNMALKNGWTNVKHIQNDADLKSLHNHKKWTALVNQMQEQINKREANYDKPLQAKLIAIFNDDQQIRLQFISAQKQFGAASQQVDSLAKIMLQKDSVNLIEITKILDTKGWVGADKIGGQANHTLFLIIQHADLKTQQKYLPMMQQAVKNNNASANSLALLKDRVALGEGKRQIYGSQIGQDNDKQMSYVLPLIDPENVNQRRAKVGLGPIEEYVKRWNIIWNVEEYKKALPEIEAKEAIKNKK